MNDDPTVKGLTSDAGDDADRLTEAEAAIKRVEALHAVQTAEIQEVAELLLQQHKETQ